MLYNSFAAWINSLLSCMGLRQQLMTVWWRLLKQITNKLVDGIAMTYNEKFCTSRGCFGSCTKPANLLLVQERSRGMHYPIDKSCMSDCFWTSSAYDIDVNSAALSQKTHSFRSTSKQSLPCDLGTKPAIDHFEFINHGLILWNQIRTQWSGEKKRSNRSHKSRERCISVCATYDGLLGTKLAFRKPIPLAEMVEFLVDTWDEEGLYD